MSKGTSRELDILIQRISQKDKMALAELYNMTKSSIYGYSLSILKNTYDAEDVLQECYLKVYAAACSYKSTGKPLAWMITITKNLCFERLRNQQRETDMPEDDWIENLTDDHNVSDEDRMVIRECMKTLNDTERQVVVLHVVSGFKHREIASIMSLPLSTVLSKYNRAIKKLKATLEIA